MRSSAAAAPTADQRVTRPRTIACACARVIPAHAGCPAATTRTSASRNSSATGAKRRRCFAVSRVSAITAVVGGRYRRSRQRPANPERVDSVLIATGTQMPLNVRPPALSRRTAPSCGSTACGIHAVCDQIRPGMKVWIWNDSSGAAAADAGSAPPATIRAARSRRRMAGDARAADTRLSRFRKFSQRRTGAAARRSSARGSGATPPSPSPPRRSGGRPSARGWRRSGCRGAWRPRAGRRSPRPA